MVEFEWRQKAMAAFLAALLAKPFQWLAESLIVLDINLDEHRVRAVLDPGYLGLAISQAWADCQKINPTSKIPSLLPPRMVSQLYQVMFSIWLSLSGRT